MTERKISADINPFGIVYNPVSVAATLERLVEGREWREEELIRHGGLWHSFSHHGDFSGESAAEALSRINSRLLFSSQYLRKADFLVVTLGTARVYELKSTGAVVANCHKIPAGQFRHFHLEVPVIAGTLQRALEKVWEVNPGIHVILTVSPVRHLSDGAVENQLSKARLLVAVHTLAEACGEQKCTYFPAYEIVMDELRDYRFYAPDMVHLSQTAVDYIWEKFSGWLFEKADLELMRQAEEIVRAVNHRPFRKQSPEFRAFLTGSLHKTRDLAKRFPYLDFSAEIAYFSGALVHLPDCEAPG